MIRLVILIFLFTFFYFATDISADVAPPTYPGYTLWPFNAEHIQLKKENVAIYYGEICKVTASFEIINTSKQPLIKKIGFPFHILAENPRFGMTIDTTIQLYDFNLRLNGADLVQTDKQKSRTIASNKEYWTGWTGTFKPGVNRATLTYNIQTSYAGSGAWERTLFYTHYHFRSDKKWPEKIDDVQITIHFPQSISSKQILPTTSPSEYILTDKSITWEFTSFTASKENTIALHFIDFTLFAGMQKYDNVLTARDTTNSAKLEAAIFFAGLAPYKGVYFSAPYHFYYDYYHNNILPNLSSKEKTLFDSVYELHKNSEAGDYYTMKRGLYKGFPDSVKQGIRAVMDRIGYYEQVQYPVIYKYITGAKRLFEEVTASEPKNAAAWKAYINNYYRIEDGGCSPCIIYAGSECNCTQKMVVQEAYRHCGDDSTIALWYSYLFPTHSPLPDTLTFRLEKISIERFVTIELKSWQGGWSCIELSSEQFTLLKKVYTESQQRLVLKKDASEEDCDKVVELLGGCNLYREQFCQALSKLKKQEKKPGKKR